MNIKCSSCKSYLEEMSCANCGGSGEGYTEGTLCTSCNGMGTLRNELYCPKCDEEDSWDE